MGGLPIFQNSGAKFVRYTIVNGVRIPFFACDITPLVAYQHNQANVIANPRVAVTGGLFNGAPPNRIATPQFALSIGGFQDVITGLPLDITFVMARRAQQPPNNPGNPINPGPENPLPQVPAGNGLGEEGQVPEPHSAAIFGVISLTLGAFRGLRLKRSFAKRN